MKKSNLKLGLCCLFYNEPIKFKTYTNTALQKLSLQDQKDKILGTILHNINTLQKAIDYCYKNNIDSYRFSSDLFPHFQKIKDILTDSDIDYIKTKLSNIDTKGIIISCHPGQHVNLGSINEDVVQSSILDIEYHNLISSCLKSNEINIHLGGTYGDKESAKNRFIQNYISYNIKNITIENDELSYSVEDCLEVANILNIPVTFDLHHHRCHSLNTNYKSEFSELELFYKCKQTWINTGYNYMRMHISSPKDGYSTPSKSRAHSDFINQSDIPEWLYEESENFTILIDVEAKAKESAIFKIC